MSKKTIILQSENVYWVVFGRLAIIWINKEMI